MRNKLLTALLIAQFLALAPIALASTTWYVNGSRGSDSNNCKSPTTACKTIKHAISLASSGDSIMVAAATYKENLTINKSLNVIGSGATKTIIDGGGIDTVIAASNRASTVTLSHLTIRNGEATTFSFGGGILNQATMIITNCGVTTNFARQSGGGIENESGKLTINNSTITGNSTNGDGAGIENIAVMTINNSTISDNKLVGRQLFAVGGGIFNVGAGTVTMNNSTVYGNTSAGIFNSFSTVMTSNSTISGNKGSGIWNNSIGNNYGPVMLQNSIVANSSDSNCAGPVNSKGHNLSSDKTCNFNGPCDMNNTDPLLGPLQSNGGPTRTQALLSGSPAIDAGNPSGCTDGSGHLLKTDQRGKPRPDAEDAGGCDMGAYERQTD